MQLRCLAMCSAVILAVPTRAAATPSESHFSSTGAMTAARSQHAATLMVDGRVLLTGGVQQSALQGQVILATAELYDPERRIFRRTADMQTSRRMHTSTLLPDGRILIVGGYGGPVPAWGSPLASAELYDPATDMFVRTGDMIAARGGHSAVSLPNGNVLIVGGSGIAGYPNIPPAEVYHPDTGTFTAAGAYVARDGCDFCAPAIPLRDGRVLFTGQYPAQIYDPVTNLFTATGMPLFDDSGAVALLDGRGLLAGGETFGRSALAEIFDPARGVFSATGSMTSPRVWHTLTLLPSGLVLAAGGETDSCSGNACTFAGSVASAELYDPSLGTFAAAGSMTVRRESHTATLLNDGTVLIAGGAAYAGIGMFDGTTGSAEVYTPDVMVPKPEFASASATNRAPAIFHAGTSDVVSPADPAAPGETLDVYCLGLSVQATMMPQMSIGGRPAPLVSLGNGSRDTGQVRMTVTLPANVATGAVPVWLTYIGRSSDIVTIPIR